MGTEASKAPTHPKPSGKMVELYLGRNVRGATIDGPGIPILKVGINGYDYELKMGEKNTVPYEVYQQLMNAKSRTVVPDVERAERAPRPLGQGYSKEETLCDYEVVLTKEE
jgi:hypothetical protein